MSVIVRFKTYIAKYFQHALVYLKGLSQPATTHRKLFFYFSKALGAIFFIAFLSLAVQFNGLYSSEGILPINSTLNYVNQTIDWIKLPHFFMTSADSYLWAMLALAMGASLSLILGFLPLISTVICWMSYVSFVNLGSVFMSFQWDVLLLEVAFFSAIAMPTCIKWTATSSYCPPKLFILLARVCCFRLLFFSGLVKLLSADPLWAKLTALNVHYFTQPLPHMLSWVANLLPSILDKLCVIIMFVIELVVPFLLFAAYKIRKFAALSIIGLMIIIMLTGNYCFFNLLTIIVACLCFNDSILPVANKPIAKMFYYNGTRFRVAILSFILIIAVSTELVRFVRVPVMSSLLTKLQGFHIASTYGLFASMTTVRNELEIWASQDKQNWKTYEFKYKPNKSTDKPKWVMPHQPRLDWQCWFVSLRAYNPNSWILNLADRLFQNKNAVNKLFAKVPFERPPKYLVFVLRNYTFSTPSQLRKENKWWQVGEPLQYSPVFENPYLSN
jgi:lipase maturation factor 1